MEREEAISRIKAWNLDPDDREVLATIIPELLESEDERIRKELLDFVRSFWTDHKEKLPQTSRWVTYLEKQKEQKPALKQTLDAYKISDERATAKMEWRIEGRQDVINNPEEYGLQKPAEWSEADEDNLKAIIRIIEDNDSDWKELTDWLKSLRSQSHWKPSEEQMEALFTVLEHEAEREGHSKALEIANGFYDNLKKLM